MTKKSLIQKYNRELKNILDMFDAKEVKEISNIRYRSFAESIRNFIIDLKSLPNEPKVVRNNEQKVKKCACGKLVPSECDGNCIWDGLGYR